MNSRIAFDTDALNHLHDGSERHQVTTLLDRAGKRAVISPMNVAELAATEDEFRRDSLLDFAAELRAQGDYRLLPHPILGMLEPEMDAWLEGKSQVSFGVVGPIEYFQAMLYDRAARTPKHWQPQLSGA